MLKRLTARYLLALFAALFVVPICVVAQDKSEQLSDSPQKEQPSGTAQYYEKTLNENSMQNFVAKGSIEVDFASQLADIKATTEALLVELKASSTRSEESKFLDSTVNLISTFFGVLIGGFITWLVQRSALSHAKGIAEDSMRLEIGKTIAQWKLEQLSKLYGPLHAYLLQSTALYNQMNEVLISCDSNKFRLVEDEKLIGEKRLQIKTEGDWENFRTVTHMDFVYGHSFGIEGYFDEIIIIGRKISQVIQDHAGYARAEDENLVRLFGQYLAHFAVLSQVHNQKLDELPNELGTLDRKIERGNKMAVLSSASFPKDIYAEVNAGYAKITAELRAWQEKSNMKVENL